MTISIKLFARAKDLAGREQVELELPDNPTGGDVREALGKAFPGLLGLLPRCALAVNNEFADDSTPIPPVAEVALLPPVSGG